MEIELHKVFLLLNPLRSGVNDNLTDASPGSVISNGSFSFFIFLSWISFTLSCFTFCW